MTYDLAIIGGGPAGYTAAERAAQGGLNVVLFEKKALGGVCLNEGCIPTKTLLYSAKLYQQALSGAKYGIAAEHVAFDYAKICARKTKVVRKLAAGIRAKLQQVTVVQGEASVKNADEIVEIDCGGQLYEAERLLICSGSETALPPIKGIELGHFWTSREALQATEVPESIAIVGGGVIGMEFAGLFSAFGSKVTIVEMASEILPGIDAEIAALLRAEYEKRGVAFHLGARVLELQPQMVKFADENGENELAAQQILLCVGRRPNVQNLGLEPLCLERFRNGLKVDEQMRTSHPRIYAAGDVTGFSMLAHTAVREAEVAVNHILGIPDAMTYDAVPGVVYTNPEVAGVGVTEAALQSAGAVYSVKKLPMTYSGRFVAENEGGNGLCKLIFDAENRLKGAHLIGNPASELVATAALAIEQKLTVDVLAKLIFPHPSVGEILKETLLS
ncbi:MAG: dihydrolipoyl dehydrogenase [Paludibacteraceae bacterium]|nr:dihydrolipoyl dehydrogenase [Paludibacteraceae bacterium]